MMDPRIPYSSHPPQITGATQRTIDLALALAIIGLATVGVLKGFDAAQLISGDALYPVQMVQYWPLDFRPPPPNRIFPDVLAHLLISPVIHDPLTQKLVAGSAILLLVTIFIGLYKGHLVYALTIALFSTAGLEAINSTFHYALPLLILLYQVAKNDRLWRWPILALAVFSDLLALFPLAILLTDTNDVREASKRLTVALLALTAAAAYSDLGAAFAKIALVLPIWIAALVIARHFQAHMLLCTVVALALLLAAFTGLIPLRYAIPIAIAIAIALTDLQRPNFNWRYAITPLAMITVFATTTDSTRANATTTAFDCLARTLADRRIQIVATDHWTAKPLYFAHRKAATNLIITQTDFADGDIHPWMAPYSFHGRPTIWGVRYKTSCRLRNNDRTYCGQATIAPVIRTEQLCNEFELYQYTHPIPQLYTAPPQTKLQAISRALANYIAKARNLLARKLGIETRPKPRN